MKPSSTHILSPLGLTAFSRSWFCLCFGGFISIFITLARAAWEAGDLIGVYSSLKCLLKIGAHPRGAFQSPCECLKPHTRVLWKGVAAAGSAQLGTALPAIDREVLGVKNIIFILLLCGCGEVTSWTLPLFWMISRLPAAHRNSVPWVSWALIPWNPDPQASVSCSCFPVTQDRQSLWHAGFAKIFSTVTFCGGLHKTWRWIQTEQHIRVQHIPVLLVIPSLHSLLNLKDCPDSPSCAALLHTRESVLQAALCCFLHF